MSMRKIFISVAISLVLAGATMILLFLWLPGLSGPPTGGTAGGMVVVPAKQPKGGEPGSAAVKEVVPPGSGTRDELRGKVSERPAQAGAGRGISGAAVLVFPADLPQNVDRDSGSRERVYLDRFLGRAAGEGGRRAVAQTLTARDGSYAIPLAAVPSGNYLVLARHPRYVASGQTWARTGGSAELNFQLVPGEFI